MNAARTTVVIFGSTGTAGSGAVRACLDVASVAEVRAVTRKPLGFTHSKLVEVTCADFENLAPIATALRGVDVCLFCLGVSARIVRDEPTYRKIHVGFALAAVHALERESPHAKFIYLSGQAANLKSRMMWARVKAEAEVAIAAAHPASASVRPGLIYPMRPSGLMRWIMGPLLWLIPPIGIRAIDLGRAMYNLSRASPMSSPVENNGLRRLGEFAA